MPISGVVVSCRPGREAEVAEQARLVPGVEVHGTLPNGQLVAVIEAASVHTEVDLASQLEQLDGVISVQVAYHNFEDVVQQGGADGTDEA
ncbi:periplasmic nitrate reductase chaperone NapD [Trichlorobacter thiogenes]|uniref:Chaperone NapD n=1 Tax=Trichlorobacter thiogenes TaxID=115783 RepID=A0A1T4LIB3_9BACT|nr:chaperone NapD [Trichlorobacter thiogenes]SJZ54318.1 periplasmic nitrate reductase chaperone NapD [Trichlorobacter thiogenes]